MLLSRLCGYTSINRLQFLQYLANVKLEFDSETVDELINCLAASAAVALSAQEEKDICDLYGEMDTNNDQTLERNELLFMLRHAKGAIVDDLKHEIDNCRGYMNQENFMAAMCNVKIQHDPISYAALVEFMWQQAQADVADVSQDVLITELEEGWGSTDGGPAKPPAIMIAILRPGLVAKLGRPGLAQQYVKKLHCKASVTSPSKQNTTVNPESVLWAAKMVKFSGQLWNMIPGKGVEMGDTLLHVAARAMNQSAIRFLVEDGVELSRKNAAGVTPYECIPGSTAVAEQCREEFPADWVERHTMLSQKSVSPIKQGKQEISAAEEAKAIQEAAAAEEDDFFASLVAEQENKPVVDPKADVKKRNAKIRAEREAARKKALGLDLPPSAVVSPVPVVEAPVPVSFPPPVSNSPLGSASPVHHSASPVRAKTPPSSPAKVAMVLQGLRSEMKQLAQNSPSKSTPSRNPALRSRSARSSPAQSGSKLTKSQLTTSSSPAKSPRKGGSKIDRESTVAGVESWKSRVAKESSVFQGSGSGRRTYEFSHQ